MSKSGVMFSVILATRNRPARFRVALKSVLDQTVGGLDVIVVNDGSEEAHLTAYQTVEDEVGAQARVLNLEPRPNGHGHPFVRNFGVSLARGRYVCFLDDDDVWTDQHYLECARRVIQNAERAVDLHLADQAAFLHNRRQEGPIWIEGLANLLRTQGSQIDAQGAYTVTVDELLKCGGFCHLNTMIVHRALFEEIGGLDENLRYEPDRDFFLRAIDRAAFIKYLPRIVSRHNIPDPGVRLSASTSTSTLEKRVFQLRVLDKAILFANHPAIRAHGRLHKAYTLKKIAEELAKVGRINDAQYYARLGLGARPTWKWLGYTAWQSVKLILAYAKSLV
jgi:glycosyltransferase involved in cell wall biosynthesis